MAEKLTGEAAQDFNWTGRSTNRYPWSDWFDGGIWKLEYGTDKDIRNSQATFSTMARNAAIVRGGKIHSRHEKDGERVFLYLQFYKPDPAEGNNSQ